MAMSVVYTNFCGMLVSETRGGVERDYVPDTLGSTAALVDETQTITDRWEYWPYGEVSQRSGSGVTPFTFVGTLGYFKDVLDKAFYVRARYLKVMVARWLTVDPLWPNQSAYSYVGQRPVNVADPSGLWNPVCIGCGICIGVGIIGALLGCLGSPLGTWECVKCWCLTNPTICGALVGVCAGACALCIPGIITISVACLYRSPSWHSLQRGLLEPSPVLCRQWLLVSQSAELKGKS